MNRRIIVIVVLLVFLCGLIISLVNAIEIGDLVKIFGFGYLIDRFSEPLNKFINQLTLTKGVENKETTKVVPILSVGTGTYVGAAQVMGPKENLDQVKAVAQLEGKFERGTFRAKVLIPVSSKEVIKELKRIYGVGVTAVIDIKI